MFELRGHSTTTWTEFCHFLKHFAWTVFIPWALTKTDIFWPLPPSYLVHVLIKWPLSKIFDVSKIFALPDTLLKSKNYCISCITLKQKIIQKVWNIWQQQIHQDVECKKLLIPESLLTFAYLILQIDAKGFKYSTDTQNHNLSMKLQEIDLWQNNKIKQFGG